MCKETPALACNFGAINAAERDAHKKLASYIMAEGFTEKRELEDGYAFRYDAGDLMKVAQYVANEQLCCSFLDFEIHTRAADEAMWLYLRGQGDVKGFLDVAFQKGEIPVVGAGRVRVSELSHA